MSTGDRNALNLPGQQAKDTATDVTNWVRLAALRGYLCKLPSLDFSDKGHANVCARFRLSQTELSDAVLALQARSSRPTSALLRPIGAAANGSHDQQVKGGAAQC